MVIRSKWTVRFVQAADEKQATDAKRQAEMQEMMRRQQENAAKNRVGSDDQSSSNSSQNSSASSSASCCINGKYNECDSGAAAAACVGWGRCYMNCMMGGASSCDSKCVDENPLIKQCHADSSKDHTCK